MDVNAAPHDWQRRRRQTLLRRFWSRELVMSVDPLQYMHTIATYCHTAYEKASG